MRGGEWKNGQEKGKERIREEERGRMRQGESERKGKSE